MAELRVKSTGTLKLFENDNTSSVTIASPASLGADRTVTLPDGDVTLVAGTMSTGISWQSVKTSTVTAVAGEGYPVNTTAGAITVNLPAGVVGEQVAVVDYAGTFDSNACTIAANGSEKIKGTTDDATMATERQGAVFTYIDATQGWVVTSSSPDPGVTQIAYVTATGPDGAAGTTDGDYKYHVFNASKTGSNGFSVSGAGNADGSNTVEYLVVAGGGGGGASRAAGGGAGGMRTATGLSVTVQDYDIVVGAGGAGSTNSANIGSVGDTSSAIGISTVGGGGGSGAGTSANSSTRDGGSGGGTTSDNASDIGQGTAGEGNDGGTGGGSPNYGAGGGGGKGAVGSDGDGTNGGDGGAGSNSSITGSAVGYAGGGGGGTYQNGSGGSASHGGGAGGVTTDGTAGTTNRGGGAGGGGFNSGERSGGAGGSGVVIIRYKFQN